MSAPISLAEVRNAPVPEVVAEIEALLERARQGEIRGFAISCCLTERCAGTTYVVGDGGVASLVYGVQELNLRLMNHH